MIAVRDLMSPCEYSVEAGDGYHSHWVKELEKRFKKSNHPWSKIEKSLTDEYRFFDQAKINYPAKYNTLSSSESAKYLLVKHEVKIPSMNKSASGGGYRMGLFIEAGDRVVLLFVGSHEDYKKLGFSSDKECFKHLLKKMYPDLYNLIFV